MIHPGRGEGSEIGMADVARCRGRHVGGRLAKRLRTVVTACTVSRYHAAVVVGRRFPDRRSVTVVAGLRARRDMRCRTRLSIDRDVRAVMAGKAIARGAGVVHVGWRESVIALVAGIALCRGRYVIAWLG